MFIIKWILLIAILKYSHGNTLETKRTIAPIITDQATPIKSCGVNKECVRFYLCDNGTLVTNGNNLIDLRVGQKNDCDHYMDVCCESANKLTEPKIITVDHPFATKCGVANSNGVGIKIKEITDNEAQFGEYPWMVAVLKKEKVFGREISLYHCGGSLIHPSVVLTSSHNYINVSLSSLIVRAGEWDTHTTTELFPFVESNVVSIETHPKFHRATGIYSIGLLFLETPILNDEHINTICLPPSNMNFDDQLCFVSGWGKHKISEDAEYPNVLKKIDLPIIENEKCTEMFRKTRLGNNFILNESLICAGGNPEKDTCKGDGGSPLVCPIPGNEGHFYQAGIVAWGIGCGGDGTPGAYTKVALFGDWIEEKLQINGYSSNTYTL